MDRRTRRTKLNVKDGNKERSGPDVETGRKEHGSPPGQCSLSFFNCTPLLPECVVPIYE